MKHIGLIAAGVALVFLGAATAEKEKVTSLPGFPDVKANTKLLEPLGKDKKPLLKIVRGEYDPTKHLIIWLLELKTDIGTAEKVFIDRAWYSVGATQGPMAYFFDKDKVALAFREVKLFPASSTGPGKKGDRVRESSQDVTKLVPGIVEVDIRQQ